MTSRMNVRRRSLALLMLTCAGASQAALAAPVAVGPRPPSSVQMVDALNQVFTARPHERANHASGLYLSAVFTPSPVAMTISTAPHFQTAASKVLVRFSKFGGIPDVGDADAGTAPYGLALKFDLGGGRETDLVMHSYNGFPSATAADFVDFLHAMAKSPPSAAQPTALETYADSHPAAKAFLAAPNPAPASFGSQTYFGVNTFKFTNAAGAVVYGRYRMVPLKPAQSLNAKQASAASRDYLHTELARRLAAGPMRMRLQLQLAGPGDALEDPSIAWPDSRRIVELGQLVINMILDSAQTPPQGVVFLPDELPDGIEANDPMIGARTRAYAESLERRSR